MLVVQLCNGYLQLVYMQIHISIVPKFYPFLRETWKQCDRHLLDHINKQLHLCSLFLLRLITTPRNTSLCVIQSTIRPRSIHSIKRLRLSTINGGILRELKNRDLYNLLIKSTIPNVAGRICITCFALQRCR